MGRVYGRRREERGRREEGRGGERASQVCGKGREKERDEDYFLFTCNHFVISRLLSLSFLTFLLKSFCNTKSLVYARKNETKIQG